MDLNSQDCNLIEDTKDTMNKENDIHEIIGNSFFITKSDPNFSTMLSSSSNSGSGQSPISNAQNMKISLCRINNDLLENYLNAQDSCSTSLDMRYHLLLLELDEIRRFRECQKKYACVFSQREINLLPFCDDVQRQSSHYFIGPKSIKMKNYNLKSQLRRRPKPKSKQNFHINKTASENTVSPNISNSYLSEDEQPLQSRVRKPRSSIRHSKVKIEYYEKTLLTEEESKTVKLEESLEKLPELPPIKVEVVMESNESKSPNLSTTKLGTY